MRPLQATWTTTVLCAAIAIWPVLANAESVAEFYLTHPITIYIASDPGGGYDVYTRTFAKFLPAHLPSRPQVALEFIPGAGGIAAVNFVANKAPRDGSVLGAIRAANIVEPLLQQGAKVAQYDPRELTWIGNVSKQQGACFTWHTSPIRTIEQAMTRDVNVGATSPLSNIGTLPNILNELIGTRFKVVIANDLRIALESGRVEGICGMSYSTVNASAPDWISGKKLNFLAQTGLEKTASLPDVPMVSEFAKSNADRAVFQLLDFREVMGRPFVAPAGVPNDRVAALRRAFDETVQDPEFLAEAKTLNLEVEPTGYKGIEAMITSAYSMPSEVVNRTWQLMHAAQQGGAPK